MDMLDLRNLGLTGGSPVQLLSRLSLSASTDSDGLDPQQ